MKHDVVNGPDIAAGRGMVTTIMIIYMIILWTGLFLAFGIKTFYLMVNFLTGLQFWASRRGKNKFLPMLSIITAAGCWGYPAVVPTDMIGRIGFGLLAVIEVILSGLLMIRSKKMEPSEKG